MVKFMRKSVTFNILRLVILAIYKFVTQMIIYYLTILPPKMSPYTFGESGQQNECGKMRQRLLEGHLVFEAKMKGKRKMRGQRRNA